MTISFEDRVAIVTGAGGGLGRGYALELARRGARVVVNDLGGARDGSGSSDAAEAVAEEIRAAGGMAMASGASVTNQEQVEAMVARARSEWGGVHILINNAGILRDKSFAKMAMDDFRLVVEVHLIGSAYCTKAVWELMREQGYGRILMTSSSTGLSAISARRITARRSSVSRDSQDAPPRRRQIQYPRQQSRADGRDANDGGTLSPLRCWQLQPRERGAGRALPRFEMRLRT
jgi:NAD(P)-dependent dehydrogenase (short-subunit alcohol dehydrogenase family)